MTRREIGDLPKDVEAFLAAERAPVPIPREARDRLAKRLATASAGMAAASTLGSLGSRVAHFFAGRAGVALVSLSVGTGAGAGLQAAMARHREARRRPLVSPAHVPPAPQAFVLPLPVPLPAPPPELPAAAAPPPHHRRVGLPPAAPPTGSPAPAADGPSTLEAERTLLETGRTALTRGDVPGALAALAQHAESYPHGELAEERESLRVQVLLAAGRRTEAQVALRAFEANYPDSLGLSMLRNSVTAVQ